jgi:hypothetical protein
VLGNYAELDRHPSRAKPAIISGLLSRQTFGLHIYKGESRFHADTGPAYNPPLVRLGRDDHLFDKF